jgi:hypothetical protein
MTQDKVYSLEVLEAGVLVNVLLLLLSAALSVLGFHHVAREVWTVDVEPEVPGSSPEFIALMCDTTGEDPSCHNSACRLGLCTSIADHLTYLQHPMYRTEGECSD